ncbi:MAG: hypothetical protein V3U49_05115 [Nitrososphaerales archaeon]|jgi:hypothetical protein
MVEIIEKPLKRLVVGESIFYNKIDDLATVVGLAAATGHPIALNWAEGVVYIPLPAYSDTDIMIEKYLEGEMHWASVAFSEMKTFEDKIRVQGLEIPVIDVSRSKVMNEVASWLKNKIQE